MKDISTDKAELVALWVESISYGIFINLFYNATLILTRNRCHNTRINWPLVMASITIFLGATAHLIIVFCRVLAAFIDHRNDPGGPVAYYYNLKLQFEISQASIQIVVSFLGDSMAVYRVFVVYNHNWLSVIVPIASLSAALVASIASVVMIASSATHVSPLYAPRLLKWMSAFFALTFATCIISTSLIAIRIWYIGNNTERYIRDRKLKRPHAVAQKILVESAMLYSSIMLVYLVTYLAHTNYSIIFGDMVCPTIGITFSLITIRFHGAFHCRAKETSHLMGESHQSRSDVIEIDHGGRSLPDNLSQSIIITPHTHMERLALSPC